MSKSFDATVQIVTARVSSSQYTIGKEAGQLVAEYIHEIYKELASIEKAEATESSKRNLSATID